MALDDTLQQNDVGITLQVTAVQQDGVTPQNISGATSLFIYLYQPNPGTTIKGTGSLTANNGTDGVIQYTTQTNDLYVCGIYGIRGQYSIGGDVFYTDRGVFVVEPNP